MLLENDASWKEQLEDRISKLEESITQNTTQPLRIASGIVAPPQRLSFNSVETDTPRVLSNSLHSEPSATVTLNLSCSLGAFPASSMITLTMGDIGANLGRNPDLISCGIISQAIAEELFTFYKQNLNPCIHNILTDNDTLSTIRTRSPLFTTAICTVSALCTGSEDYNALLKHFTTQVSGKVFSSSHTFDDVRALCIGALWLNEISTALNSLAVRISTELDLHRCITKMPHTKRACYDRTRLYWLVYLCDHHCSLIHGRPPLTRDFNSLRRPRDFLQSYFTNPSDLSLISQVELWSMGSRVFDVFGADIECSEASQRSDKLAQLSAAYDGWLEEWLSMLSFTNAPATFSRRVFDLYFHSAKLYLFSHIFRGSSQDTNLPEAGPDIGAGNFAHDAVRSALGIIRCIVDDNKSSSWLGKLPNYIGTMVAFACVCLVKVSAQQGPWDRELQGIPNYLQRLVQVLLSSPVVSHPTHPLLSIARSLETATAVAGGVHDQGSLASIDMRDLDLDLAFFDMFTSDGLNGCPDSRSAFSGM
ncbi:Transcription factor, fungi [Penicillium expansum]|nr:Transcription factor, fungi [Penicillium expansum]